MLEMFLKRMRKSKNQKGFTLVELIVVIAILGILAAVAVSRFSGITTTAKENSDYATASTIASAASAALAENPKIGTTAGKPSIAELNTAGYLDQKSYSAQSVDGELELSYDTEHNNPIVKAKSTPEKQFFPKEQE